MSLPEIRRVTVEEILPLRSEVLRGGGPLERALLPGDEEGLGVHWGVWLGGLLVACVSLYEVTADSGVRSTQLRGMATAPGLRSQGLGGALLEAAIRAWEGSEGAARPLWCNARIRAVPFYERHRFVGEGEPFEVPGVGEHLRMTYLGSRP
ncbi:MAG: GNAT family N-acetyltransferase [Candidatus Limnocylindrus sp.]